MKVMNEQERIRLAEAMYGPCAKDCDDWSYSAECPVHCALRFRPFTDANDDYAVLEWMREQHNTTDADFYSNGVRGNRQWDYRIGDYARAALRGLDQ